MFNGPALMTRIAIGKGLGFLFGLLGFLLVPILSSQTAEMLLWGILFWYITLGAMIGVFGVFTYHPILKLPMPWWIRAPLIGGWMNFLLTLFIYDDMVPVFIEIFGPDNIFNNPFWLALEGAIIGFIIDFVATRYAGEGYETVTGQQ